MSPLGRSVLIVVLSGAAYALMAMVGTLGFSPGWAGWVLLPYGALLLGFAPARSCRPAALTLLVGSCVVVGYGLWGYWPAFGVPRGKFFLAFYALPLWQLIVAGAALLVATVVWYASEA